jgi:simple sugar transport system permease protein
MTAATSAELAPPTHRLPPLLASLGAPIVGGAIGLLIGALLMLVADADPVTAYAAMFQGAFGGTRQLTETLLKTAPLLLVGLGLTIAFRARVWNIGGEGQYYLGALCGGIVALSFPDWPRVLLLVAMFLAGIAGGAFWALIPALFKIRARMSEIISTLMFNYIAILLLSYLARGPLQEPGGYLPVSAKFDPVTRLPLIGSSRLHIGVIIVLILVPIVYYLLWHTPLGFRLRAVGSQASVASYAGISVSGAILTALLLSGALAGMSGIMEVSTLHFRLKTGITGGYGFSGILVALLGRMNPLGVVIAALFFAALTIGSETMHILARLPPELADAIQAVIVLSVLAVDALARKRII